jgi:tetratricopeptide (TPR) repeat protein
MSYINEIVKAIEISDIAGATDLIEKYRVEHEFEPDFIAVQAMLNLHIKEFKAARDVLIAGLEKHPGDNNLLYNLGYVYICINNGLKALECYEKLIEISNDATFITELKQICNDIKESREYKQQLSNSISENNSHDNYGIIEVRRISGKELEQMEFPTKYVLREYTQI